jgi:hypothetical protein
VFRDNLKRVKAMIRISAEHYDALLANCDPSCLEYATLKNGTSIHYRKNGHELRIIEILCEVEQADAIFGLATKNCPDALPAIERAFVLARDW